MSDIINGYMKKIPDVSFIDNLTIERIQSQMIEDFTKKYKELTGVSISLAEADPNRLILYACALEIYQLFQYVDRCGKQDLLKYSYGKFLDNLAALKGVTRLQEDYAQTTLRFTLSGIRNTFISIPQGTKVSGPLDIIFYTTEYAEIEAGKLTVEVNAKCVEAGLIGNKCKVGSLNTLVDLIPYVSSVTNITDAVGGTDIESDESFAERVYIAPSRYSTAGPIDAYEYWVRTFSSAISNVKVASPTPGEIDIRFLMENGEAPSQTIIDQLEEFLRDGNIRPMSDWVHCGAPTDETYNINATYYINKSDSSRAQTIRGAVERAINDYIAWQLKIGRDINPSELIKRMVDAGAKRVNVIEPVFTAIDELSVARIGNNYVSYGGLEDD